MRLIMNHLLHPDLNNMGKTFHHVPRYLIPELKSIIDAINTK